MFEKHFNKSTANYHSSFLISYYALVVRIYVTFSYVIFQFYSY